MALYLLHLSSPTTLLIPSSSSSSSSSSTPLLCNTRTRESGLVHLQLHRQFSSTTTLCSSSTVAAVEQQLQAPSEPRTRLIAQNIPWACTAEDIKLLFEKHGTVIDVELSMYNRSRNRGLAFIKMASEEDALVALNNLNSYDLDGRIVKVEFAKSLNKKSPVTAVPVQKYNVFVGNLAWRVRSKDLRELFDANWNVLSADVIFQSNPRRSAGYGFLSFASKEEAEAAVASFNGKRLMGRPLRMFLGKQPDGAEEKLYDGEQSDEVPNEVNANLEQ